MKIKMFLASLPKSYFHVPKHIRLNSMHYFVIEIPNKQKIRQAVVNYSSDIDFKNFVKFLKLFQ